MAETNEFVALGHAGSSAYVGLESKSLKIYLSRFRGEGAFCEALAVQIRDDVAEALELPSDKVHVTLRQKARGGITITASA